MQSFVPSCSAVCHLQPAAVSISTTGEAVTGTAVRGLAAEATTGPEQALVAPVPTGSNLNALVKSLCLDFIKAYKDEFQDQKEKYFEYLQVMEDIKRQRIGLTEMGVRLQKLLEGHDNLIMGFNSFMPKKYEIKLPKEQKPLDIEEAISLVNKVKDYFQNEEHSYSLLLNILSPHMRMKKSTAEVLPEVAALCGDQELVEQFVRFLSQDAAATRTPEPTSSHKGRISILPIERKPQMKKKVKGCDSDPKLSLGVDLDGHEHVKKSGDGEKETGGSDRSHQMLESLRKEGNGAIHMKRKRGDRESEDETEMYMRLVETQMTEVDESVLVDVWVSSPSTASKKMCMTKSDEIQNQHEDDLYELDMLLVSVGKTIKQVKKCLEKMSNKKINIVNVFHMDSYFTVASIRCIEKVYGDYGLNVIDLLQENSERAFPIILTRLQQKRKEWKRYRANI